MQSPAQSADEVLASVIGLLKSGAESVGFVSPSHFAPHVKFIIENLRNQGYFPVTVYNSNGYDSPDVLREMEGLIDIYLPDYKYFDPSLSRTLSDAADYPDRVKQTLREMYRQKGNTLIINERGIAIQGLIIRHLVLPGYTEDSIRILKWVAEELSPRIHISLMAQYDPNQDVFGHPRLSRMLTKAEYRKVHAAMEDMGFERGWIQEHTSSKHYAPDFREKHPFEKDNNYEIGANE
jgi:putative pyruvate formate lyase activating enzyme